MKEIFLSASIPYSGRKYFENSDPVFIHAAVRAFALLFLGRRHIIWGGHPSITPMLWAACEHLGMDYAKCLTLYQSRQFEEDFPEANKHFKNVRYVESAGQVEASLHLMRVTMLNRHSFSAAVFIGGMEGIEAEYSMFRDLHPNTPTICLAAAGGGARAIAIREGMADLDSTHFTKLLIDRFGVHPTDPRDSA